LRKKWIRPRADEEKEEAGVTFVLHPIRTLRLFNLFSIAAAIVHIAEHRPVLILGSVLWLNCYALDVLDPDQDKPFSLKKAKWKQKQIIMLASCTSAS
jgi:hypothetical protein